MQSRDYNYPTPGYYNDNHVYATPSDYYDSRGNHYHVFTATGHHYDGSSTYYSIFASDNRDTVDTFYFRYGPRHLYV